MFQGNVTHNPPFDDPNIDNAQWVGLEKTNDISYYLRVSSTLLYNICMGESSQDYS